MRGTWIVSCGLLVLVCGLGRESSACPAVALGGCAQTVVVAPALVATSAVAVQAVAVQAVAVQAVAVPVVTTFAVPTVLAAPAVIQQQVIVRQRPVRVRSRTVIRSSSGGAFGLGIF